MKIKCSLAVIVCLSVCIGAQAGTIIGLPASTGFGNCSPFGCYAGTRYQQVYSASQFPGPFTINDITFYDSVGSEYSTTAPGTYKFHFSTTSKAVDALDTTFANNVGIDDSVFAVWTGGGSDFPSFTVTGTPFNYNPVNGNLLLDIFISSVCSQYLVTQSNQQLSPQAKSRLSEQLTKQLASATDSN